MKKEKKGLLQTIFKGMFVGGTMLVPGVSGGSMAMILGIYDRLIKSVSNFVKNKKENFCFLGLFAIGGIIGMLLFAKPIDYLIEIFTKPMLYFFIGAVVGGVPMIYKKANVQKVTMQVILYLAAGGIAVILFAMIPVKDYMQADGVAGMLTLLIAGVVAAVALVLPGISVSYMFLIMGVYDKVISAIKHFDISVLLPLGLGGLIGIALTTKLLDMVLSRYPKASYMVILGFVLASAAEIFPGIPSGIEWVICPAMFAIGYFAISLISSYGEEN